jgi:beta-lactamase regulating signal transducer with metallopeptidase domain
MSSTFFSFFDQSFCLRFTQSLFHFVWQASAIAGMAFIVSRSCRTASARVRHAIHGVALVLMAACFPATFVLTSSTELPSSLSLQASAIKLAVGRVSGVEPDPLLPRSAGTMNDFAWSDNHRPTTQIVDRGSPPLSGDVGSDDRMIAVSNSRESSIVAVLRIVSPYAVVGYVLGVAAMIVRLCAALYGGHRLRKLSQPITDRKLLHRIRKQASRVGLKVAPVVAFCDRIAAPVVSGILRPIILLPIWLATEMDPEQVLVILTHEMAHIRRFDVLLNLLQRMLETVLFFHPAVWYVSRQLSFERESCCDDAVVAAGYESLHYASTLVSMAELCAKNGRSVDASWIAALAADGGNGSNFKRRICRLLDGQRRFRLTRADSLALGLIAALFAASGIGYWESVHAEPSKSAAIGDKDSDMGQNAYLARQTKVDEAGSDNDSRESQFRGKVVNAGGNPISRAEIAILTTNDGNDEADQHPTLRRMTTSDSRGDFSFCMAPITLDHQPGSRWTHRVMVSAKAPGYGYDFMPLAAFEMDTTASTSRDVLRHDVDQRIGTGRFNSRTLKLPAEAGPVQGRLVDLEGRPLINVEISVEMVQFADLAVLNQAFESSSTNSARRNPWNRTVPGAWFGQPDWNQLFPKATTDRNGEFTLQGLGRDQVATVTLRGERISAERFHIVGTAMEKRSLPHIDSYPNGAREVYVGLKFTMPIGPSIPVSGIVREFQSGRPIVNASVFVERLFSKEGMNSPQLRLDREHIRAVTDSNGRFELLGIPPGKHHVLYAIPPQSEPCLIASREFSLDADRPEATVDMKVFRGVWIEGIVKDAKTGKPIRGTVDYMALQKNRNTPRSVGLREGWKKGRFRTDEIGHYRVVGLPGPGVLLVSSREQGIYPLAVGVDKVEGYERARDHLPTTPFVMPLSNWNVVDYVDLATETTTYRRDLTMSAGATITGRVVGPDGLPASQLEAMGLLDGRRDDSFDELKDDSFTVRNLEPDSTRELFFKTSDSAYVGHWTMTGVPLAEPIVQLQPGITATGRLIETETDDPAIGYHIYCRSSKLGRFGINDTTADSNGRFVIKGLLAGNTYELLTSNPQRIVNGNNHFTIDLTDATPGGSIDLGDVTGKLAKRRSLSARRESDYSPSG